MKRFTPGFLIAVLFIGSACIAEAQGQRPWMTQSNDRLVVEALHGLGVNVPLEIYGHHVLRAFSELYPQERYDRYRLTPMQARAVAYVSVIFAAGNTVGHPMPPTHPDHGLLGELREAVYNLATAIPARGSLFLTSDERQIIRETAPEIGRMATVYGCLPLADAALELNDLAAESMPDRAEAAGRIDQMRRIVADC